MFWIIQVSDYGGSTVPAIEHKKIWHFSTILYRIETGEAKYTSDSKSKEKDNSQSVKLIPDERVK